MIKITIPKQELWNEVTEEFEYNDEVTLYLEHNLLAISKWEEIHKKRFLNDRQKTAEEIIDYIWCMVYEPKEVDKSLIQKIPLEEMKRIDDYINDPASATKIDPDIKKLMARGQRHKRPDDMTSEMLYYYISAFRFPPQCETWRLPRLLNLVEIANIKEWEKDPKNEKKLRGKKGPAFDAALAREFTDIRSRNRAIFAAQKEKKKNGN